MNWIILYFVIGFLWAATANFLTRHYYTHPIEFLLIWFFADIFLWPVTIPIFFILR